MRVAQQASAPALRIAQRVAVVQRMQSVPNSMQYEMTTVDLEQKKPILLLALRAFQHMRDLVIHADKDGPKGKLRQEDIEAAKTYREYDEDQFYRSFDEKKVGAFAVVDTSPVYATNRDVPKSAKARHQVKGWNAEYIGDSTIQSNQTCEHAEMKIFRSKQGALKYIGVSKLCCLYCAAQMLACGFTGFRGCHMKAFNNYMWLPEVDTDSSFRAKLWGSDVEYELRRLNEEQRTEFRKTISNGATLLQKYVEWYNTDLQPLYPKSVSKYSEENQYSYDTSGYDSDDENRKKYFTRLNKM